jgi:hypothetical protein
MGNDPVNRIDPSGLAEQPAQAGAIKTRPVTIGMALDFIEKVKPENLAQSVKHIKNTYDVDANKVRNKVHLVAVEKEGDLFIRGAFVTNTEFSTDVWWAPCIVQRVKITYTGLTFDDKTETMKLEGVPITELAEGWVTDKAGVAKGYDQHQFKTVRFNMIAYKQVELKVEFEVGIGVYDGEIITGMRGPDKEANMPGMFDVFPGADAAKKVTFIGQPKKYNVIFKVYNNGKWELLDESANLKKTGQFNKEDP